MKHNLSRNVTLWMCLMWALLTISGLVWQPHNPHSVDLTGSFQLPSALHWLGTDHLGRDVASRLMIGAQTSLFAIFIVLCGSLVVGLIAGTIIAVAPSSIASFVRWLAQTTLAIPTLIMALFLAALIGPGLYSIALALIISAWAPYALSIAALVDRLRAEQFWRASLALGASPLNVVIRHLLPNTWPVIGALAGADAGRAVILVTSLGFLGLSADTGQPEWGAMIYEYRMFLFSAPHLVLAPVFTTALSALLLNIALDR
ncbi:ABC transporter permease [Ahrensia marina]|uniref:ABC transmembrane type-1 domain-containing protein n=1 Tax=Ahrensia marina TaxID=1514904 RepID=A0A0M9GNW6_9HYPH|nr:ABC transporter permease [Ahrensia marina]KPB02327.1 hypothetical protein SU32_03460 [Ahrensia marina]